MAERTIFSSTPAASLESSSSAVDTLRSCSDGGISGDLINSLLSYSIDYKWVSHPRAEKAKSLWRAHLPRIQRSQKIGICLHIKDTPADPAASIFSRREDFNKIRKSDDSSRQKTTKKLRSDSLESCKAKRCMQFSAQKARRYSRFCQCSRPTLTLPVG